MLPKQIAIYGKGGIGKSTTSSNLAVAMALHGKQVMLVGCDPKQDSTMNLNGGVQLPSVLERIYERGAQNLRIEDVCFQGPNGIVLVESGGPDPGVGCAGRGVITALQTLDSLNVVKHFGIDVVIYDVLGDVVCGGFAMPLRQGYAKEIYLVTSGELMALYAANNICKAIQRFASSDTQIGLGGLILNRRNIVNEEKLVHEAAAGMGTRVVAQIPRDKLIQKCEARNSTVLTEAPDSPLGRKYMELAEAMLNNQHLHVPHAMSRKELLGILGMFPDYNEVSCDQVPLTWAAPHNNNTAAFKAMVALAALEGNQTLAQLTQRFDVQPSQIVQWKDELLERAAELFASAPDHDSARAAHAVNA